MLEPTYYSYKKMKFFEVGQLLWLNENIFSTYSENPTFFLKIVYKEFPIYHGEVAQLQIFFDFFTVAILSSNIHFKSRERTKTHWNTLKYRTLTCFLAIFAIFFKKYQISRKKSTKKSIWTTCQSFMSLLDGIS